MTTNPLRCPPRPRGVASLAAAAMALGALVSLAACGSATPTRYYAVEGTVPSVPAMVDYRGPAVLVRDLRIPAAMDRPELVNERAGGEVQLREFDRWAAPLDRNARQALTQSLAARLPPGSVVFAGAARPVDRIDVNVEVLALRIADGNASMWVAWGAQRQPPIASPAGGASAASPSLSPSPTPTPTPTPAHELRLSTPAADDAAATAKAWSTLLGQLADRIAADLATQGAPQ